ncbi:MAG TPA: FAD-dependent oxidoreductase [Chryseolinea sp.]|nr:FAD-dependent oxidoreductase [Chryseolinea sp.]
MDRDGKNISLWQDTQRFMPNSKPAPGAQYDVVIVGGGMTGVMTAVMLQTQGKNCLLAESHNLGFGTTGGTTAHLNTLLDTPYHVIAKAFGEDSARTVATAASEAIQLIENNIRLLNIECEFARSDAFLFSQSESETNDLERVFQSATKAGLSGEYVTDLPIPVAFEKAARFQDQAKFNPLKYLFAIASEFERLGGTIAHDCHVSDVHDDDGKISVTTSQGVFGTEKLVYATHIPPGINLLHLRCAPWRSYAMALKLAGERYPAGLIYDLKDPYHYYRSQTIDGQTYLIVGGKDHKTGENENTEHVFATLHADVERIFNIKEITHQWSSQYFESADGLPYIGHLPGSNSGIYVATGFGGNGMIYSHIAAQEITRQILTGESIYENLFSPSRIKPIAGFNNFVTHNVDVVKHFVGKWISLHQLGDLAEIAPGEGRVVKVENKPVALYKSENGKLHAVSSICTHMKCNVVWNGTERSWDCPCHGARYSPDGKVLTGPASQDLEVISLKDLFASEA